MENIFSAGLFEVDKEKIIEINKENIKFIRRSEIFQNNNSHLANIQLGFNTKYVRGPIFFNFFY